MRRYRRPAPRRPSCCAASRRRRQAWSGSIGRGRRVRSPASSIQGSIPVWPAAEAVATPPGAALPMLLDALLICVLLMGWGAQATAPWRLAAAAPPAGDAAGGAGEEAAWAARGRRLWRYSALPLAVGGLIAAA